MLNYIKSELYLHFNRKGVYTLIGSAGALCIGLFTAIVLAASDSIVNQFGLSTLLSMGVNVLMVSVYLVLIVMSMTCSEEHKFLTFKNTIASGMSREKLYISKVISTILVSSIAAIAIVSIYLVAGALILGLGDDFTYSMLSEFLRRFLLAAPLWMGAIGIGIFLSFLFKNENAFSITYVMIFLMAGNIIDLLSYFVWDKIGYLRNILLTTQFKLLANPELTSMDVTKIAGIGIMYLVVFSILGVIYTRKMDFK